MIVKSGNSQIFIKKSENKFCESFQFHASGLSILIAENTKGFELCRELETTIGSSHWITEESDFYRFNKASFKLSSIFLNVPWVKNTEINFPMPVPSDTYDLSIEDVDGAFFMPSMKKTMFSISGRYIACFNDEDNIDRWREINLSNNFSIFIYDETVVGYKLTNPLSFLVGDFSEELDKEPPTPHDYFIFSKILFMLSDDVEEKLLDEFVNNGNLASFTGYNRVNNLINTCVKIIDDQW